VVESTVCDGFGVRGVAQCKCALVGVLVNGAIAASRQTLANDGV
jgi:hypothetical protein